jgi:hypothetical protein
MSNYNFSEESRSDVLADVSGTVIAKSRQVPRNEFTQCEEINILLVS